jgi:hypothetical protein
VFLADFTAECLKADLAAGGQQLAHAIEGGALFRRWRQELESIMQANAVTHNRA